MTEFIHRSSDFIDQYISLQKQINDPFNQNLSKLAQDFANLCPFKENESFRVPFQFAKELLESHPQDTFKYMCFISIMYNTLFNNLQNQIKSRFLHQLSPYEILLGVQCQLFTVSQAIEEVKLHSPDDPQTYNYYHVLLPVLLKDESFIPTVEDYFKTHPDPEEIAIEKEEEEENQKSETEEEPEEKSIRRDKKRRHRAIIRWNKDKENSFVSSIENSIRNDKLENLQKMDIKTIISQRYPAPYGAVFLKGQHIPFLSYAAFFRAENVFKEFFDQCNFADMSENGWKAIHYAAAGGDMNIIKMLENNGALVEGIGHCAILFHQDNLFLWAVENNKILINQPYFEAGDTLLHCAAKSGNVFAAKYLLEHGAAPNQINSENESPLLICCQNGNAEIVKLLLDHHVLLDVADNNWTPLHAAVFSNYQDIVKMLLLKGADPFMKVMENEIGISLEFDSPFAFARQKDMIDLLNLTKSKYDESTKFIKSISSSDSSDYSDGPIGPLGHLLSSSSTTTSDDEVEKEEEEETISIDFIEK